MKNLKHGVMKTAIDWLENNIDLEFYDSLRHAGIDLSKLIQQAKLLEKEQLRTMHLVTWMNPSFDFDTYYKDKYENERSNIND